MDYYQPAWLVLLLSALFLNVAIFLLFRQAPAWLRALFTSAAISLPLFPVIVETDAYGQTFAPLLAQLAVDLLAGHLELSQISIPLVLLFVELIVLFVLLNKYFSRALEAVEQD